MNKILEKIKISPKKIEELKGDGSNRKFYRIFLKGESLILILPQKGKKGIKEAEKTFIIGNFLKDQGIPVPEIKHWDKETGILLVEDLGNLRLYEVVKHKKNLNYYFQAIEILILFQHIKKNKLLKLTNLPVYTKTFILEKEVLYGLKPLFQDLHKSINLGKLKGWIEKAWKKFNPYVLVHRDFQSKNLMIKNEKLYLIDFQGMIIGPPSYDLASLIYDPYTNLENTLRKKLIDYYIKLAEIDKTKFLEELKEVRCFRILQALGAFYKLSSEGKLWFKKYIPEAIKLLKEFKVL